jgi:uroporphyrinogen decarboxylase
MTSRQRVEAALEHRSPDRVPIDVTDQLVMPGTHQALLDHLHTDDFSRVLEYLNVDLWWVGVRDGWKMPYLGPVLGEDGEGNPLNEWGYSVSATLSRVVGHRPLGQVSSVQEVEEYAWPDPDWWDYSVLPGMCAGGGERAILLAPRSWSPTFCRIAWMCGMEKALCMMYDAPAVLDALVARITGFYLEVCRRACEAAGSLGHIYYHGDDVATQLGLMFSLDMWRRYFKDPLRQRFELVHRYGLKNMFHSCGAVRALMPDLIEIGMDILMPVQTHAVGMEPVSLKREFGQDLTFFGGLDIQQVLPFGTPEEVREEVRRLVDVLGESGGYIFSTGHQIQDDTPLQNILAAYQEAHTYRGKM